MKRLESRKRSTQLDCGQAGGRTGQRGVVRAVETERLTRHASSPRLKRAPGAPLMQLWCVQRVSREQVLGGTRGEKRLNRSQQVSVKV